MPAWCCWLAVFIFGVCIVMLLRCLSVLSACICIYVYLYDISHLVVLQILFCCHAPRLAPSTLCSLIQLPSASVQKNGHSAYSPRTRAERCIWNSVRQSQWNLERFLQRLRSAPVGCVATLTQREQDQWNRGNFVISIVFLTTVGQKPLSTMIHLNKIKTDISLLLQTCITASKGWGG